MDKCPIYRGVEKYSKQLLTSGSVDLLDMGSANLLRWLNDSIWKIVPIEGIFAPESTNYDT